MKRIHIQHKEIIQKDIFKDRSRVLRLTLIDHGSTRPASKDKHVPPHQLHCMSRTRTGSLSSGSLFVEKEKADLVIVGKQSIDSDNGQVGQMLAGLLDWPQSTFASKIEVAADKKSAAVTRETDKGTEQIKISLPAVVTADLRLNEPRYTTLPNIMKAKKKPIETLTLDQLGLGEIKPQNQVLKVEEPPVRKAGGVVDSVDTLINKLKNEAKVI